MCSPQTLSMLSTSVGDERYRDAAIEVPIRLSFAASDEVLKLALRRIAEVVTSLR